MFLPSDSHDESLKSAFPLFGLDFHFWFPFTKMTAECVSKTAK